MEIIVVFLERWRIGVMEDWSNGVMEDWRIGVPIHTELFCFIRAFRCRWGNWSPEIFCPVKIGRCVNFI